MRNIWRINREQSDHPKRNNFDLSFVSHSTFKFGYLYPVFKRKVYPGDSFQIDAGFDLKMMPVEFPVQSRMRAHMHFFYVKNKNLWKNWEDWIDGLRSNQECPHPYLQRPDTEFLNGSIHDFLGQSTTVVMDPFNYPMSFVAPDASNTSTGKGFGYVFLRYDAGGTYYFNYYNRCSNSPGLSMEATLQISDYVPRVGEVLLVNTQYVTNLFRSATFTGCKLVVTEPYDVNTQYWQNRHILYQTDFVPPALPNISIEIRQEVVDLVSQGNVVSLVFGVGATSDRAEYFNSIPYDEAVNFVYYRRGIDRGFEEFGKIAESLGSNFYTEQEILDALPYRAYEAIYRSFYANDVLQPLIKNGRKEYNKFVTNDNDGADTTPYHLFRRNYEYDFLTSALPSPQAGPAPLVGMSALGEITVTDENGITTAQAVVDESTGKITDVTVTSPLASIEHGRTIMRMADVGMSINDFRNVNALTRLKERILRSGYRYKPFKKAIWGVDSSDDVLGMPEFIGGFSRDINISPIYSQANTMTFDAQGVQTGGDGLGDWAGVGRVVGGSEHTVSKFFDDYGWVIGIMSITPVPAYSQLIPKENLCPTNYLDYYFPDMAQLGLQPIPYSEVAPLQTYVESLVDPSKKLTDVFGYQRPNYDMVGSVDEVHGEFRGTLRNMVINRIFDRRPELGSEFLEVNPSEINDIFINTDPDADVFIGHLAFRIYPKRPLPRVHIPGLGF